MPANGPMKLAAVKVPFAKVPWKRSIGSTVMLSAYIVSIVVDVSKNLSFLRYLTPFKYFAAATVMKNQAFEPVYLILSAVFIAIAITH